MLSTDSADCNRAVTFCAERTTGAPKVGLAAFEQASDVCACLVGARWQAWLKLRGVELRDVWGRSQ